MARNRFREQHRQRRAHRMHKKMHDSGHETKHDSPHESTHTSKSTSGSFKPGKYSILSPQVKVQISDSGRITFALKAPPIENGVFEGAGILGASYWKVLRVMERNGVNLKRIGGSSAGACFATLMSLGYKGKQLEQFGRAFAYSALLDLSDVGLKKILKSKRLGLTDEQIQELKDAAARREPATQGTLSKIATGIKNFILGTKNVVFSSNHGIYKGNRLLFELRELVHKQMRKKLESHLTYLKNHPNKRKEFIQYLESNLIAKVKGNTVFLPNKITFRHLHLLAKEFPYLGFKDLYITGTNSTKKSLEVFSHETEPHMEIALATRISMSIPGVFQSVSYKGCKYVDGGCLKNFPIDMFNPKSATDTRFKPDNAEVYIGPHGQNYSTVGFKADSPGEVRGFSVHGDLPPPSRGAWGTVKYKVTKWAAEAFSNVKVFRANRAEYELVRQDYLARTVQIPAYDLDEKNPVELRKFSSTNFSMDDDDKEILANNGEFYSEEFFKARRNELLDVENYENITAMSTKRLQELNYILNHVPVREIFSNCAEKSEETLNRKRDHLIFQIERVLERRKLMRAMTPEDEAHPRVSHREEKHYEVLSTPTYKPKRKDHYVALQPRKIKKYPPTVFDSTPRASAPKETATRSVRHDRIKHRENPWVKVGADTEFKTPVPSMMRSRRKVS
jgi:predicted acylesterase/phospholipase RssA